MNRKVQKFLLTVASAAAISLNAAPTVSDIRLAQRYPWNGKVDITFNVSEIADGEVMGLVMTTTNVTDGTAIPMSDITDYTTGEHVSTVSNGAYHLVWNAFVDYTDIRVPSVRTYVTLTDPPRAILGNAPEGCVGVQLWEDGPFWAEMNIGATNVTDTGLYFWWGDTVGYRANGLLLSDIYFSIAAFPASLTWNKNPETLRKEGWVTSLGELAPSHDAARVKWGGEWRMPKSREFEKLADTNYCSIVWTNINNVNGWLVSGVTEGYEDKSIFLPASGFGFGARISNSGTDGRFWSSDNTAGDIYQSNSFCLCNPPDGKNKNSYSRRCYGQPIRPVR